MTTSPFHAGVVEKRKASRSGGALIALAEFGHWVRPPSTGVTSHTSSPWGIYFHGLLLAAPVIWTCGSQLLRRYQYSALSSTLHTAAALDCVLARVGSEILAVTWLGCGLCVSLLWFLQDRGPGELARSFGILPIRDRIPA